MTTPIEIANDNDPKPFDVKDYGKIAAALWAVQAKEGAEYTRRIVESVLNILNEAGVGR